MRILLGMKQEYYNPRMVMLNLHSHFSFKTLWCLRVGSWRGKINQRWMRGPDPLLCRGVWLSPGLSNCSWQWRQFCGLCIWDRPIFSRWVFFKVHPCISCHASQPRKRSATKRSKVFKLKSCTAKLVRRCRTSDTSIYGLWYISIEGIFQV